MTQGNGSKNERKRKNSECFGRLKSIILSDWRGCVWVQVLSLIIGKTMIPTTESGETGRRGKFVGRMVRYSQ